jgi:hypothetical protein
MYVMIFGRNRHGWSRRAARMPSGPECATPTDSRSNRGRRSPPKTCEIVHTDLWNYEPIETHLSGFDARFFCLGVSSSGTKKEDHKRVTYGITMAAADASRMTFIYVSGARTASSERAPTMWARIRGKTDPNLLQMPFAA